MKKRTLVILVAFVALGCAPILPARFADGDAILEVSDDVAIPVPERRFITPFLYADAFGRRPLVEGLDLRRVPDALDVNQLDDVPSSSWFVHPAGGPLGAVTNVVNGPPIAPLLVLARHPESDRHGLVVIDARGLRYELGRDPRDRPWMRTTAAAVATPLLRALGYRTPEVSIVALPESDLRVERVDDAPPPTAIVREFLDAGPPPIDGRYRVSATRWPIGVDVGPTPHRDPREDDPNDRVPHGDRRTLRALKIFRAWLKFQGFGLLTLRDVYVGAHGKGHLQHFVIGLEGALGSDDDAGEAPEPRSFDPEDNPTAGENPWALLATLGLRSRDRRGDPRYPRLGDFAAEIGDRDYERGISFEPAFRMLPADGYWAAKQLAAITSEVIGVAVDAARTDDATRAHLVEVLDRRRLAVIVRAFAEVTPCDVERTEGDTAVLRDFGFSRREPATYELTFLDDEGVAIEPPRVIAPGGAMFTVRLPPVAYSILRVRVTRGTAIAPRAMEAHFRLHGAAFRLVGERH